MSRRRVTINDVAKLAGVSYQTVSRVINNKPNVSTTTRQRVQEIITETGYRPSPIARSLVTARTATIGLVVPDISNPYFSAIARGVEQVAYAHNYSVLLCNTGEDASRELEVLHTLDERYVDGVIACGLRQEDAPLQQALAQFRAAVLVNRRFADEAIPAIMVDDVLGGYMATQHLLQIGPYGRWLLWPGQPLPTAAPNVYKAMNRPWRKLELNAKPVGFSIASLLSPAARRQPIHYSLATLN